MDFRNKYLKYKPEITFDIFEKIWNKLVADGWNPAFADKKAEYNYFSTDHIYLQQETINSDLFGAHTLSCGLSETTVQEILGCDPFVKGGDFVLPEKWIKNGATPVFDTLKVNSDNTINVKLIKESYTRAEVISLLNDFGEHVCNELLGHRLSMIGELNKWAEENL